MGVIKASLPKGTRDFLPEQMLRRQFVMDTIKDIFEKYGYEPLETPSIEKLEVLSGKYGEEGEQLIFKVLKRGTGLEDLLRDRDEFVVKRYSNLVEEALRYDLTVPLSRVVAMHENELTFPFKRYQIQPVWRADRPQKGRYREFYQCDVDVVGTESMLADAEAIGVVYEVLSTLGFENFKIRVNNRKILNGILDYAGIVAEQTNSAFIAIDKLDKIGLDGVKSELLERGIEGTAIERLMSILEIKGTAEDILSEVEQVISGHEVLLQGTRELREILSFLQSAGVSPRWYQIDLFLVRGLGYYTGPIHEAVVEEPKMGSLTGGGRYDQLIGMFLGRDIPATGTAFGIERIIDVMNQLNMFPESKTKTLVLVTLFDESTVAASLGLAQTLRKFNVPTECYFDTAKLKKQFTYADRRKIPYVAIVGPEEMEKSVVALKNMKTGEQRTMSYEEAVKTVEERL